MPNKAKHFVIISQAKKGLLCFRCNYLPLDPIQCQNCDSIICRKCFEESESDIKCPKRVDCAHTEFAQIKTISRVMLEDLKVRCKICKKIMGWDEVSEHANYCITSETTADDNFSDFNKHMFENNIELTQSQPLFIKNNNHKISIEPEEHTENGTLNTLRTSSTENQLEKNSKQNNRRKFVAYLIGSLIVCIMASSFLVAMKFIFFKDNAQFRWLCADSIAGLDDICLLSVGHVAIGIIAIGQVAIGIISISHANIGLLFGIGQVSIGIGFNAGLGFVCGYYSAGVFALGLYKVKGFGYQYLRNE